MSSLSCYALGPDPCLHFIETPSFVTHRFIDFIFPVFRNSKQFTRDLAWPGLDLALFNDAVQL
jgi:hypothetical protein